ncbi:hypothetical protein CSOJ01_00577 [Colletotrichum sojae]|uniref:Uncharacterized protein n=1 Tax=Colletotrichum sojae TaxID=2175907 RepID=A0A8H6JXY9_9PEZI|nr:hypothetical protein CSOJ01_00577 [Colletotrichum sojae]
MLIVLYHHNQAHAGRGWEGLNSPDANWAAGGADEIILWNPRWLSCTERTPQLRTRPPLNRRPLACWWSSIFGNAAPSGQPDFDCDEAPCLRQLVLCDNGGMMGANCHTIGLLLLLYPSLLASGRRANFRRSSRSRPFQNPGFKMPRAKKILVVVCAATETMVGTEVEALGKRHFGPVPSHGQERRANQPEVRYASRMLGAINATLLRFENPLPSPPGLQPSQPAAGFDPKQASSLERSAGDFEW